MAGYTRQDNTGQIANNEVIDADDLNAEFNAVKVPFKAQVVTTTILVLLTQERLLRRLALQVRLQ